MKQIKNQISDSRKHKNEKNPEIIKQKAEV